MAIINQIQKELAGVEDLLFGQGVVTQTRAGNTININKLNADKIPYSGDVATSDFVSILTKMDAVEAKKASSGNLVLSLTGGSRTLTTTEFDNVSFDITGILTSNQTLVIPDSIPILFVLHNQTTGAFTLTIKHSASAGVVAPQGQSSILYTTGTLVETVAQSKITTASEVTNVPSGNITETDVQGALNGLEARKLDVSTTLGGFVGAIKMSAMGIVPAGHLECDGLAVSRTTYADLFTQIGTTYGAGDGSTTFNVPDLRGEFVRGWDNGRGVDSGRTIGTSQSDLFKSHTHTYTQTVTAAASGSPGAGTGGATAVNSGATGGAETRPRNVAVMFVIQF